VLPPLAVSVEDCPEQILVGLPLALMVGNGLTLMVILPVPVQPDAVPVTEYVVDVVGETVIAEVVAELLQV